MLENFYVTPGYNAGGVGMLPEPRERDTIAYLGEIKEWMLDDFTEIQSAQDKIKSLPYYEIPGGPGVRKNTRAINIDMFAIRDFYQHLQAGSTPQLDAHERNFDFALLTLSSWVKDSIAHYYRCRSWESHQEKKVLKVQLHRASVLGKKKKRTTKYESVKTWWMTKLTEEPCKLSTFSRQVIARQFIKHLNTTEDKYLLNIWRIKFDSNGKRITVKFNIQSFAEHYIKPIEEENLRNLK